MRCKNCNSVLNEESTFCPNCGIKFVETKEKNPKKNKIIILFLILIGLAIIAVATFFIIKYFNQDKGGSGSGNGEPVVKSKIKTQKNSLTGDTDYYTDIDVDKLKIEYENDISKKIKIEKTIYIKDEDGGPGDLYILGKNENDVAVETNLTFDFLDKSGARVDKTYETNMIVLPGKEFVTTFSNMTSDTEFSSYRLTVSVEKLRSYEYPVELSLSDLNVSEFDSQVDVSYKNSSEFERELSLSIVYYKDNKVCFMDNRVLFVSPNEEEKTSFYYIAVPGYSYNNEKPFDKYEIIVSGAKYTDSDY